MNLDGLPEIYRPIALIANKKIKERFVISSKTRILEQIDPNITWRPTFQWRTGLEIIVCEVSNRPYPPTIAENYSDLISSGLPIRVIVACPSENDLTTIRYAPEITRAKKAGVGFLAISNDNTYNFDYLGIPLALHLPKLEPIKFHKKIRLDVFNAYDTFLGIYPKHGVQELGQIIEKIIRNLADQAKLASKLPSLPKFTKKTPFAKILDSLVTDNVINKSILGKCRGYITPRNDTSHPKDIKELIIITRRLKENFLTGMSIIEELPEFITKKGYIFLS